MKNRARGSGPGSGNEHARRVLEAYGPWAVVTGASDGMGRALCEHLARAGFNLVMVARRGDVLAELANRLTRECAVETVPMSLDMGRASDIDLLMASVNGRDVGLLVAAAGYGTSGPFAAGTLERELDMLSVNCRAVLVLVHFFASRFMDRRRSAIVMFGSLVGWQGTPYAAHYAATKAYVQVLAEGLRVELAPHNIDILSAAPGPVASGFARRAGMRMGAATSTTAAAADIFRSLGRSGTIVPGALGKLLTYSLAILPRRLRIQVMARVMRGMTGQHEEESKRAR